MAINKVEKKRVGMIGLGAISGMSWGNPQDACPYNHAGGLYRSSQAELAVAVDLSAEALQKFRAKWGTCFPSATYSTAFEAMRKAGQLDIIAICVRGPLHREVFEQAVKLRPRAIFLEKPPSCSLADMDAMVALMRAENIPVTVSYSRHWSPKVLRLEQLAQEGLIGDVRKVVAYCGGNVLSMASHATDLMCQFAGYDPQAVFARGTEGGPGREGYEPEPQLGGMMVEYASGAQGFQVGCDGEHGCFYCDVFGAKGRIRAGIYIPPFVADAQGKALDAASLGIPEERSPFSVAYEQIAAALDGHGLPACTGNDFIAVNEIGFGAIESLRRNQRIELPNVNRSRRIFANG